MSQEAKPSVFEAIAETVKMHDPIISFNEGRYDRRWALSFAVEYHKCSVTNVDAVVKTAEAFIAFLCPQQSPSEHPPMSLSESTKIE
jgi:hypothetical protein